MERKAKEVEENAVSYRRRCQDLEAAKFRDEDDVEIESAASSRTRARRRSKLEEEKFKKQRLEEKLKRLQAAHKSLEKGDTESGKRVASMPGIPQGFLFSPATPLGPPPGFATIGKDLSPFILKRETYGHE